MALSAGFGRVRLPGVGPAGCGRVGQAAGDARLINAAIDIHHDDPEFGYRFIADELAARGIAASRNRVNRLCMSQRIFSAHARKRGARRKPGPPVHDDLVRRQFAAAEPDTLWLTDLPNIPPARAVPSPIRQHSQVCGPAMGSVWG